MVDYYIKNEVDTLLYTNYPSLAFIADIFQKQIDSSLNGYTTSAQLHTDFYSKVKAKHIPKRGAAIVVARAFLPPGRSGGAAGTLGDQAPQAAGEWLRRTLPCPWNGDPRRGWPLRDRGN